MLAFNNIEVLPFEVGEKNFYFFLTTLRMTVNLLNASFALGGGAALLQN